MKEHYVIKNANYNSSIAPGDRVIYVGGYTYYALVEDTVYTADTGEVCPLSEEEELQLAVAASEPQYYEKNVSLTLFDIFNKEVGYIDGTEGYSPDMPFNSSFVTLDDTYSAYLTINKKSIKSHCAPTAAVNVFSEYKEFDIRTILYLDWEEAKEHIEKGALLLHLKGSQIYEDHCVLATGYISFLHSSGWNSRYFRIIDGTVAESGYVNYSLGIDCIHATLVEP